jgi:hypothetical protein
MQKSPPGGTFTAPGLPHKPQSLLFSHKKRNVVHGPNVCDSTAENAFLDRKVFFEIAYGKILASRLNQGSHPPSGNPSRRANTGTFFRPQIYREAALPGYTWQNIRDSGYENGIPEEN